MGGPPHGAWRSVVGRHHEPGEELVGSDSGARRRHAFRSLAGNRVLYRDGVPTASLSVGEVTFFSDLDPATEWQARQVLLRAPVKRGAPR